MAFSDLLLSTPDGAVRLDAHAVIGARRRRRYIAPADVARDEIERPLGRIAVAAAAARLDDDAVVGAERQPFRLIEDLGLVLAGAQDGDAAGLGRLAALHAPGRTFDPVEVHPEIARAEDAVALAEAEAAAEFPGTGRILAQGKLLDAIGIERFLQLDRDDPRVAMRHGAEGSGAVMRRASAPAAMAGIVAVEGHRGALAIAEEAHR